MVLRSVGVLSVAKVMAVLYALMGLIFGGLVALFSMAGVAMNAQNGEAVAVPGTALGIFAIIVFPIIYGIGGFIGGLIMGVLYNIVAGICGGVELNFDGPAPSTPMAQYT